MLQDPQAVGSRHSYGGGALSLCTDGLALGARAAGNWRELQAGIIVARKSRLTIHCMLSWSKATS